MERKLSELDFEIVVRFEFLDTPGDEIAPGSNEIGKNFENEGFGHGYLLINFRSNRSSRSTCWLTDSMVVGWWKSKGFLVAEKGRAARKLTLR